MGICNPNFTETLFDMASQRRLKKLCLGTCNVEQILPNFSEALSRFKQLEELELYHVNYSKIN